MPQQQERQLLLRQRQHLLLRQQHHHLQEQLLNLLNLRLTVVSCQHQVALKLRRIVTLLVNSAQAQAKVTTAASTCSFICSNKSMVLDMSETCILGGKQTKNVTIGGSSLFEFQIPTPIFQSHFQTFNCLNSSFFLTATNGEKGRM
jgi:hypothetical protein